MSVNAYLLFNLLTVGLILMMACHVLMVDVDGELAIECYYQKKFNKPCASCGFTRDFRTIFKEGLESDKMINRNSISIFSFFSIQLFLRLLFATIYTRLNTTRRMNVFVGIDIVLSSMLFAVMFHGVMYSLFGTSERSIGG